MNIIKHFTVTYQKKRKHRSKCRCCGKLIQDGEVAEMVFIKYEPETHWRRGVMRSKWIFYHIDCFTKLYGGNENE